MGTDDRGFASMDESKQREIASKGGKASGGKNLENVDRSAAGKKGAAAQPTEAKRRGGQNSHGGGR
jgi:general stress protein YciG